MSIYCTKHQPSRYSTSFSIMHIKLVSLLPIITLLVSPATAVPPVPPFLKTRGHSATGVAMEQLGKAIPGSYIVVLKKDVSHTVFRRHVANAENVFSTGAYRGYSTTGYSQEQADALALSPAVSLLVIFPLGIATTILECHTSDVCHYCGWDRYLTCCLLHY